VPVKSFFWIKTQECSGCHREFDLFAGYRLAQNVRHPRHVLICAECGDLNEVDDPQKPGACRTCHRILRVKGNVVRGKATCPRCGCIHRVPDLKAAPYKHRLFALEYVNPRLIGQTKGRFFKKADEEDIERAAAAKLRWEGLDSKFVPSETIPAGDESDRLHRWGYRKYKDLFHPRQLLGLELSARFIAAEKDERIRRALATNLSDLLRYQNQLCRYDSMALKVLDIFSIHGFPVGLMHAEANILGILHPSTKAPVGSGGWTNIIDKFHKAKSYCDAPFEIRSRQSSRVAMKDEWIGEFRNGVRAPEARELKIFCKDAAKAEIRDGSVDAVFTDPPYFGNVQYAELMDFCYVWLRRLVPTGDTAFAPASTRHADELTGNITLSRGVNCFASGLSSVYSKMARALKAGSPLAFTFHHNSLEAYCCIAVAILDSGLTCSATIPAPAEMGGSIHITGTGSSIIDTIFICRSTGRVSRRSLASDMVELGEVAQRDVDQLMLGGVRATPGDIRCVIAGHLTRLAIWHLRQGWRSDFPISIRLARVGRWFAEFGTIERVVECMNGVLRPVSREYATARVCEVPQEAPPDESFISF